MRAAITSLCSVVLLTSLCACSRPSQTGRLGGLNSPDTNSLALTPVTSAEDSVLLYTVPLGVDVRTNSPNIFLLDNGKFSTPVEFTWQTNGGYLVEWDTIFASFGPHALQVTVCGPAGKRITGPVQTKTITNLVCFDLASTSFGTKIWIHGTLAVRSADYRVEFFDVKNMPLDTITGHTEKGIIDATWPCTTTDGHYRGDQEFKAEVFITPATPVEGKDASKANRSPARYNLNFSRSG